MSRKIAVLLTILCSVHIFGLYYNISDQLYYVFDALGFTLIIYYSFFFQKTLKVPNPDQFFKPLIFLFCTLFLSAISCYIFHGQGVIATVFAMRYLFYIFIYFLLRKIPLNKHWVENMILYFAVIYMTVFFVQTAIFPLKIVDTGRIMEADRGFLRFRIEGAGFLMLAAFLSLNRFILKKGTKNLLFFLLCFVALVMLGFRTLLITATISCYFLVIRLSPNFKKILAQTLIVVILMIGLLFIPSINNYINMVIDLTKDQADMGDDYIRFQTFDFFLNDVNKNAFTLFFGNGFPQENSKYGKFVLLGKDYGFIFQDLGLIGFGLIYGLLSLGILLFIYVKAIFLKVPKDSQYLGVYFFYILISSVTTVEAYRIGILGIIGLALYLLDLSLKKKLLKK